ncbi:MULTISPECIES: hypothetical protein [Desulfococcus]|jgi:hypothetical protein|uniref:Uncharacterized protein n=1 Tax=Desulfococcus multivorans DSM 2059 TaxID=1121405 RepID=S7TDH1_DESML|nr:hypothetical protein [Desulfococcus multivorans]AOY60639.1 conserved uncharacterized protein [Desulfococcus multivorans]AQV02726.1 hypothetical protein B2D07_19400 [Desulfococcus multivorans]EPR34701.1 hypothetical protein dsmv_3273 [Desulfococcus multivorans DSM 2059]MDX9818897.1 hypothetical protein [Desulfococcus multivorans]SKA03213.1 hypothetical protein SAMN02745446_02483 [Desulfococcus multivorans DSM 2059]
MNNDSKDEAEIRKRAVFEGMSSRRRQHILDRVGYEKWDPFQEPKDPIDIRRDQSKRTTHMLVREFLQSRTFDGYSNSYGSGVLELCLGLINDDERYRGMFEFSCWYRDLLEKEKAEKSNQTE